jgi:serine/threonine protein phosphatase PrpC
MNIRYSGLTDVGCRRPSNEDRFLCVSQDGQSPGAEPWTLLAVADGIGGHAAGEVASAMAVEVLARDVARQRATGDGAAPGDRVLLESFQRANQEIFRKSNLSPEMSGMGTTLVAALIVGRTAAPSGGAGRLAARPGPAANVGDSRIYRLRGRAMTQISRDHSWAAEQVGSRGLSAEDIRRSPFRNMVTRSVGYADTVEVDTFPLDLLPGDAVLLCTDGLHGLVPGAEILKIIRKHKAPEAAAAALVQAAKKAGGSDNITAVLARID